MKVTEQIRNLPGKVKKQMQTALILLCAVATFAVPAFGGGYTAMKDEHITSSAAAIEDVDLLLVTASAFGEARKVMNATDNDAKDIFIENTSKLIKSSKWQNMGLIIGARDALSGSTWSAYQAPITLSASEVATYNDSSLADAYNKYKAFGFAVQNLNNSAQKSSTTAVSVEEGLDAMSAAAIKLGSFGVKFLNDYNPGPVLIGLYKYDAMLQYPNNKLVQIVLGNDVLNGIVELFGRPVAGTGLSFFLIFNAVIATTGLALSMFLTLLGNRTIGDNIKRFIMRVVIGSVGIYLVGNFMSVGLKWVNDTILDVGESDTTRYVEENLNLYDWYLTGFQLPSGVSLQIDENGNFIFTPDIVYAINNYTYNRLVGGASDDAIKARMETYTQTTNVGTASFITPSMNIGGEGEGWATDKLYAIMKNYAENKEDLMDDGGDDTSPLAGLAGANPIYQCRYLWMSSLGISGGPGGWTVTGNGSNSYYGLNPISAFNLVRSDFSGESITATATVYPSLAYVAFDVNRGYATSASTNMNAITRFIACFTLVLAALKGLITIFTAGFAGLISGGVKTATGSAHGLGQALGAVVALLFGIIGISVIMSMTMSLLDTVYGIAKELVGDVEVLNSFLQPVQDAVGGIPVLGPALMKLCRGIAEMIMTLVLALTFPKLGGIPITMFAQYMADLPGMIAERAQMLENQLFSGGRPGMGGGLGGHHGGGQYGRRAQAMAGQAFSSSTRQAAAIVSSGAAAAGALTGASLSMAGKALNKKGDAIEGKPDNPGVKNWDDMTPEQQAKAAEAAAATENWDQMDEDARQQALKDAGVYDENTATGGSSEQTIEGGSDETPVVSEEVSGGSGEVSEEVSGEAVGGTEGGSTLDDGAPASGIPEVGTEASMNQPNTAEPPTSGEISGSGEGGGQHLNGPAPTATGDPGKQGTGQGTVNGQGSGSGDGSRQTGGEGHTTNVKEGDHTEVKSNLDSNVKQENKMDAKNVEAGQHVDASQINELGGKGTEAGAPKEVTGGGSSGLDPVSGTPVSGMTGTGQTTGQGTGKGTTGNSLPAGKTGSGTRDAQQSGASAHYTSVSQNTQTGDKAVQNVSGTSQQTTQFNASADQRTVNQDGAPGGSGPFPPEGSSSLDQGSDQEARKAAKEGAGAQTMNGTAKSKWGKEMTVKEQKQARAAHAIGDALQVMGGNRTMGEGLREALGHVKDAAVTYATPIEIQESGFMTNLRMKRMERDRRRDKRSGGKK